MNIEACQSHGATPTNLLAFGFQKGEQKIHEAQKPLKLIEFLIKLTTREGLRSWAAALRLLPRGDSTGTS